MTREEFKNLEYRIIEKYGCKLAVFENGTIVRLPFIDKKGYERKAKIAKQTYHSDGYLKVCIAAKTIYVHRLVAEAFLDDYSDCLQVDHINGVKNENTVNNIRMVTKAENLRSYQRKRDNCSSKYRGVSKHTTIGKWVAQIGNNGKTIVIGYFQQEEDAARAFDKKAIELRYNNEALNFPKEECA